MYGVQAGAEMSLAMAKTACEIVGPEKRIWFGSASAFSQLSRSEQQLFILKSKEQGYLEHILHALYPLLRFYPDCPLNFLYEGVYAVFNNADEILPGFKNFLRKVGDRHGTPGTLMQANAVYIAFVTEFLFVKEGLALANFREMENFPKTEASQRVASSVRSAVSSFFNSVNYDKASPWPKYFWHRGLELEKCEVMRENGRAISKNA